MKKINLISRFGSYNLAIIIINAITALAFIFANAPKTQAADLIVETWWPTEGVTLTGIQPFKGLLQNHSINQYDMYWQVDGGTLVQMYDSYNDYPHKEAIVDLSGWSWKGAGPYNLTFVAKNKSGILLAKKDVHIYTPNAPKISTTLPSTTQPIATTTTVTTTSSATVISTSTTLTNTNLLADSNLYISANSSAQETAESWRLNRPADAAIMQKIANAPKAIWLGNWNTDIRGDVQKIVEKSKAASTTAILVAYNIPQRDCGGYSSGGSNNPSGYRNWISALASGIGDAKTMIILEPDALAQIDCLSVQDQSTRLSLLSEAVTTLKKLKNTSVYIDAGNSNWISSDEMAKRLRSANIATANGFALNVSNFYATPDSTKYGEEVSKKINNKHFVIDTSRNGKGSNGEWCNPRGRALGQYPTTATQNPLIDAYLWIKTPGESDGTCNGGPSAGAWWPEYALELGKNAGY